MKTCRTCSVEKTESEFYVVDKRTGRLRTSCKPCHQVRIAQYKAAHSDSIVEYQNDYRKDHVSKQRARHLVETYGITAEQYEAMLIAQGYSCCMCGDKARKRRLHVDHDHATGVVRGLLCHGCNTGLGNLCESETLLEIAIEYLRAN